MLEATWLSCAILTSLRALSEYRRVGCLPAPAKRLNTTVRQPIRGFWFGESVIKKSHRLFRWAALAIVALVILAWWGWVPERISSPDCQFSENGAWISVDWTSQPVDEAAVQPLAEGVSRRGIRYLFPFVAYFRAEGTFSSSYSHASEFVSTFRRFNRETRLLAWIGVPLANEGRLGVRGTAELSDVSTREQIVAFAVELVDTAGFDGVHLDVETVRSGDESYLLLLEEIRTAIGDRILSVAGSYWLPGVVNGLPVLERFKWDGEYYRAVAERVDQIVTMTYDSGMPIPALYRLWLREQVRGIERSLAASNVELLVGISVSRENTMTHHPSAENMRSGLAGFCAGVSSSQTETGSIVRGVAVYASWEADSTDWRVWERWANGSGE